MYIICQCLIDHLLQSVAFSYSLHLMLSPSKYEYGIFTLLLLFYPILFWDKSPTFKTMKNFYYLVLASISTYLEPTRTYCIAQGTLPNIRNDLNGKRIWKRIDTCICITESLCCTPEANTTLLINDTPM